MNSIPRIHVRLRHSHKGLSVYTYGSSSHESCPLTARVSSSLENPSRHALFPLNKYDQDLEGRLKHIHYLLSLVWKYTLIHGNMSECTKLWIYLEAWQHQIFKIMWLPYEASSTCINLPTSLSRVSSNECQTTSCFWRISYSRGPKFPIMEDVLLQDTLIITHDTHNWM